MDLAPGSVPRGRRGRGRFCERARARAGMGSRDEEASGEIDGDLSNCLVRVYRAGHLRRCFAPRIIYKSPLYRAFFPKATIAIVFTFLETAGVVVVAVINVSRITSVIKAD